jgi:circadian clock protein KaiC
VKRISTGIENFDGLLGGGLPETSLVLLEGEPGSGKSNLGLEFLYRGAEMGQNGLYVSFQETEKEVLRTTTFDWEFADLVQRGTINIEKFDPYRYEKVADMLRTATMDNQAKRVVLDPITDLDMFIDSRQERRKTLLEIKEEMSNVGATCIIVAEKAESTEIEEEIADSIVEMHLERDGDELRRKIFVKKLKGSDFEHSLHSYEIESTGIKIR